MPVWLELTFPYMTQSKLLTLVLVRRGHNILLGLKKRGFGQGKWNGFGGKVHTGESIEDGAKRELAEECSIVTDNLIKVGHLTFEFIDDPILLDVHVFTTSVFCGEPQESEEMRPKWFTIAEIPYAEMWADDKYWFPLFLKGSKFVGYFKFLGHEQIVDFKLRAVTCLDSSVIPLC